MTPMPHDEHRQRVARRLKKLMDYLGKDAASFSKDTGLDRSYVGRLLHGERGRGVGAALVMKTERAYKLDGMYWTAPNDPNPADCINLPEDRKLRTEVSESQRAIKDAVLEACIDMGAHPDVMRAVVKATPPEGQELRVAWWLQYVLEALIESESDKKKSR